MGELGDKTEGKLKNEGRKLTGDKNVEWTGKAQKGKGDVEGVGNDTEEPAGNGRLFL